MGAPAKCTLELDRTSFARLFADLRQVLVEAVDKPVEVRLTFCNAVIDLLKEGRAIKFHSVPTVRAGVVIVIAEPSKALRDLVFALRAST